MGVRRSRRGAVLAAVLVLGISACSDSSPSSVPVGAVGLECTSSMGDFAYNDVFDLQIDDAGDAVDATFSATSGPPFGAPRFVKVGPGGYEATVTLDLDGTPVVLTESDEYPAKGISGGSKFGPYVVEGSFTDGDPEALTLVSIEFGDGSDGGFLCTSESGRLTPDESPSPS
jgi:hypothetical protein